MRYFQNESIYKWPPRSFKEESGAVSLVQCSWKKTQEKGMEEDILDGLEDLGYGGSLIKDGTLAEICGQVDTSQQFMDLCSWLCSEIKDYCDFKETVAGDNDTFKLDMSGFLREMECPYSQLIGIDRLDSEKNRLLVLDYLVSELMACRMTGGFQDEKTQQHSEHPILQPIHSIMKALELPPPAKDENVFKVFTNIEDKVRGVLSKLPQNYLGDALLQKRLSEQQWAEVEEINRVMSEEYYVRRQVLLKRIDLTIQSFMWSDQAKGKKDEIAASFQPIRKQIASTSGISTADVLSARKDLCKLEKTSSGVAREVTKCDINKILIGRVPDRGGRPSAEAPPPEMPSFKRRTEPPKGQRGDRGRGRGGRGRGGYDRSNSGGQRDDYSGGQGGGGGWSGGGRSGSARDSGNRGGGGWGSRGGKGGGRGRNYGNDQGGDGKVYYS
eukprot:Seg2184.1 transcript_id=Seg2184.1/GoldUCD/mRNA.D3Y31 product="Protein FAM98A" protein_id=Seg2184.1/GoldUCD/D3Y31